MRLQFLSRAQETVFRIHLSENQAILTETRGRQAAAFLSAFPVEQDAAFTSIAHGWVCFQHWYLLCLIHYS